ncbi:MAG: peptidyl-prolyl cis-trans isomerase, partial [Candidatus Binatia bacterium]|nr:peptidyl-prolyl cis-trans isomerase [Candidatus Binatia bacterium]
LKEQTLEQLIEAILLEREARQLGFSVNDEEVRKAIAAMPAFQVDGQFDQQHYLRVLRYLRLTPGEFEDGQRTQLLNKKIERLITDAVQVTEAEVEDLFRLRNERVNLVFVQVAAADLVDQVTVTPEEVETYYNTHRESFRQPERVAFRYVAYPAQDFEAQVSISPHEVEEFYTQHVADRFTLPARVRARHILFSLPPSASAEERTQIRTTAEEVLARAKAGEDFAALAKTYSQDPATAPQGGDLGFFARGRMVKPFEEAAFALPVGGVSDLIETPFGFHIIKVEAKEEERVRPLTEVEEEIRRELIRTRARTRAQEQAQTDRAKAGPGTSLAEIAQAAGRTVVQTPLVARDETIPELGHQPALVEAALALAPDEVSEPVAIQDTWYLVAPTEKAPSIIPDFAAVAQEAEKRSRSEKAEQLAREKASAVLAQAQQTKDLTAAATAAGLSTDETGPFSRQGSYVPKMGSLPELKKAAFRLTPAAPIAPEVYTWGGNAFVAALKEQLPPKPEEFAKQKEMLREELLQRKRAEALQSLVRDLKKRATITYNQEALLRIEG